MSETTNTVPTGMIAEVSIEQLAKDCGMTTEKTREGMNELIARGYVRQNGPDEFEAMLPEETMFRLNIEQNAADAGEENPYTKWSKFNRGRRRQLEAMLRTNSPELSNDPGELLAYELMVRMKKGFSLGELSEHHARMIHHAGSAEAALAAVRSGHFKLEKRKRARAAA